MQYNVASKHIVELPVHSTSPRLSILSSSTCYFTSVDVIVIHFIQFYLNKAGLQLFPVDQLIVSDNVSGGSRRRVIDD